VTYTPDAVTAAVAEFTLGVMISIMRHAYKSDMRMRQGLWNRLMGKRIADSVIGLIGFGRIGSSVARLLIPFNPAKVLVNDIKDRSAVMVELEKQGLSIKHAEKEEIYIKSDIISLHIPYSPLTKNMINEETFRLFNKDSFLINTSRGGIVNENDLYHALKNQMIQGAAVDAFEEEPYNGDLTTLDNVLLTQHMGSCSFDCRYNMELQAAEDLIRYFNGDKLQNEVPPEEYEYQI